MPTFRDFLDPADLTGSKKIKDAAKKAEQTAEQSLQLGRDWKNQLQSLYLPYTMQGLGAFNNAQYAANSIRNNNIPTAFQASGQPMQDLFSQYQSQLTMPEYQQASLPTQADYGNAQNSDQYAELMAASREAGGDMAAGLANMYNHDIAQREYANAMSNYDLAQESNNYRNQLNQNMYSQGMGLQDYLYGLERQNYANRMGQYTAQQDQLGQYLDQLYNQADMGMNAINQYAGYGTDVNSGLIDTLSGIGNAHLNAAGGAMQASGNNLNAIGSTAGQVIGNWNKE